MSATRGYNNNDIKGSRRKSIARLKSPIIGTPKNSPSSRGGSLPNSYISNAHFLRKLSDDDADVAVESLGSSAESFRAKGDGSGNSEEDLEFNGENLSSGINDPKVIEKFERHLHGAKKKGLNHEGDDIVRDLYKLAGTETGSRPRRSRSFSSFEATTPSRRGSTASSLNVPGGFRREFVISGRNSGIKRKPVNLITRNFVEFLSIYGHFAGEDLEDENDHIACHYGHVIPGSAVADEETALLPKNESQMNRTATDRKAYFLLLKAFVGTGVLFLPKAFSNGGLLFSTLTLLFFGILSYWCYLTLIYAKRATGVSSFGDIAKKLCGTWLQRLIIVSIVLSQIGFVSAYIIFTAENLKAFYATISHSNIDLLNSTHFVLIQLAFFLPLSLVRDITKLSLSALLANIFIFVGLASIVYYMIHDLIFVNKFQIADGVVLFFNKSGFSLFIGVAIFAFEGICLIIPIQESMINQDHFPKVLFQVILTISIIFIAIGSLGYYTYGSAVKTVILLNLPRGSPLVLLVQLLYAFAILLSTPLQLFPAIRLVEQKLFTRTGKHSITVKWLKNLFRFFSVSLTASIAIIGGSNLDRFVSFVGCFACIPLVYMYPPILHLKSCCLYDPSESKFENRKRFILGSIDYILVLVGGVALVYTTYQLLFT
ncbi:Piso0_004089 [Millerozyma farinosa CBS 7064]|uniref:Piso0_004089 protein n=1 Tax=Pichia sorbitophila (strain ATCC MYA-4447 / BCRC 22081 / CBS 7064 / NBRC 10061 / NRRL Y-12695) TaxID=559304 RepID=G8Y7G2_PICSO|nr:Piso0_004089 [Millerozyma farinosa CBS 7064]CCE84542.1 Piso0_004089 [Millerozyma farinosa CBS 7064]